MPGKGVGWWVGEGGGGREQSREVGPRSVMERLRLNQEGRRGVPIGLASRGDGDGGGAGSQLLIRGLVLGVLTVVAPLKAPGHTRRPKGEKKVADQEGDAVIKESRPVTRNPGRFSHNCAPDAGLCSVCSSLLRSLEGERIHCWEGLPHSGFVFTTERVLCQGVVILSVRSWTM